MLNVGFPSTPISAHSFSSDRNGIRRIILFFQNVKILSIRPLSDASSRLATDLQAEVPRFPEADGATDKVEQILSEAFWVDLKLQLSIQRLYPHRHRPFRLLLSKRHSLLSLYDTK